MHMTRRFFLRSATSVAAYCALSPLDAFAQPSPATQPAAVGAGAVARGKTLVVIFLRGGADGLNMVVPFNDPNYYRLRERLAIAPPGKEAGALDLDGQFGLHPRMKALLPLFNSGLAVAAQAVGYDRATRSHFEEQDAWETGVVGNTLGHDGWLNRHLATSEGRGPLRAVAVGDTLPRILSGKAAAYAIRGIEDLSIPESKAGATAVAAGLEHAYRVDPAEHLPAARDLLARTGQATLDAMRQLQSVVRAKYTPEAEYPKTELARRLMEVARLIKAGVGLEVAEVDFSGWDTHQTQAYGNGLEGSFGNLANTLADAMAAFAADLHDHMDDVLALTLSDFGRTAAENGTAGTDHGWANCLLALGGPVLKAGGGKPRNLVGKWPGLAPEQLHEKRDLAHTTDFRDVLAEAVRVHLGNPRLAELLPDHAFKGVGLVA